MIAEELQVVGLVGRDQLHVIGYGRDPEVPANAGRDLNLALHSGGALHHEAHAVERPVLHVVRVQAEGDVREVEAVLFHAADRPDRIVEVHARFVEVIRAETHGEREALGHVVRTASSASR